MLRFGTNDASTILQIIIDINNGKPYMVIADLHHSSVYFVKKIYKHFSKMDKLADITAELKSIDLDNNKKKVYKYDRKDNYKNNASYYRAYMQNRRLKERILRAHKLIDDNTIKPT